MPTIKYIERGGEEVESETESQREIEAEGEGIQIKKSSLISIRLQTGSGCIG